MGLMSAKQEAKSDTNKMPWYLPGGWYTSNISAIDNTGKSSRGPYPVFSLTYTPCDPSQFTRDPEAPFLPTIKQDFDTNLEDDRALLYAIIGIPKDDGGKVVWQGTGLIQWNGCTAPSEMKFANNKLDVKVKSKPPREKQPMANQRSDSGGKQWWPPEYTVEDIGAPGEAAQESERANRMLLQAGLPGVNGGGDAAPPPPPSNSGRGRARS